MQDIVTNPEKEPGDSMRVVGAEGLHEFVRYVIASAVALLADISVLTLLTSGFGIPYLLAGAIAFLVGLVIVYVLSTRWVFNARRLGSPAAEFGIFAGIGIVGLGLNELMLWTMTSVLGLFYLYSKILSVVVVFSWNFAARKYLLFRSHHA